MSAPADPMALQTALLALPLIAAEHVPGAHWSEDGPPETRSLRRRALVYGAALVAVTLPTWPSASLPVLWLALLAAYLAPAFLGAGLARRFPGRAFTCKVTAHLVQWMLLVFAAAHWRGDAAPRFESLAPLVRAAFVLVVLAANVEGGAALVAGRLRALAGDAPPAPAGEGAGRTIGILERLMVLVLVQQGEWGAVGLVLTAKSVARFKRLEDQDFAERYLVGTMTSVMYAMLGGLALRLVL